MAPENPGDDAAFAWFLGFYCGTAVERREILSYHF